MLVLSRKPGERILIVSYGSGAGSDAMDIEVMAGIEKKQEKALKTADYISRRVQIDYATYTRYRGKLTRK